MGCLPAPLLMASFSGVVRPDPHGLFLVVRRFLPPFVLGVSVVVQRPSGAAWHCLFGRLSLLGGVVGPDPRAGLFLFLSG